MPPLIRTLRLLSLVLLGALATPLAAEAAPAAGPDSSPPAAAAPAAPAPPPAFKLSGYAEGSYAYSTQAVGSSIVGRLYDRIHNALVLNAWKLTVDRPFVATKLSGGVHADLLVGQNGAATQSIGFNLGADGDVTQLYVVLNSPTKSGNGVQFKVGKMVTLMGLEVIEDVANPNWSEGLLFNYVENFTSTGVELDFKPSSAIDVELRVDNGWDRVTPTDGPRDFMGRIGIAAGPNTSLGILGYAGAQHLTTHAARYGAEVLLNQKIGGKTSVWLQGDWGKEKMNDSLPNPTQDASWWAIGGWVASDLSPKANLALRAEYLNDSDGFRTSGILGFPASAAHKLWALTGTLNVKTWPSVLVRPEVRYDHSDLTPGPFKNGKSSQATVALSVAYLY
jgi:hypothetical protein